MTDTTDRDTIFFESEWPPDEAELRLLYAMRRRTNIRLGALAFTAVSMLAILGILAWWAKHH